MSDGRSFGFYYLLADCRAIPNSAPAVKIDLGTEDDRFHVRLSGAGDLTPSSAPRPAGDGDQALATSIFALALKKKAVKFEQLPPAPATIQLANRLDVVGRPTGLQAAAAHGACDRGSPPTSAS
jgi:hypothetical protein